MEYIEWNWKTTDGLEIYSCDWVPAGKARGVVCLIHGLGEHIGRYKWDGEALTQAGYVLAGFDQRGFGKSQGPRGFTPSLETYFDDFDSFLTKVADRYPGLPLFLYGLSAGGVLVLAYPPVRHPAIKGVIATAPGLKSEIEKQKFKVLLTKVLGKVYPSLTFPSGLDVKELSRDATVVEAYLQDPLVHTTITTGWGLAMLKAVALVYKHAPQYPYPVLLMQGTEDKIAFTTSSSSFAELAPKDKVTVKMWTGFKHELHTDPDRAQVFKFMVDWLNAHN